PAAVRAFVAAAGPDSDSVLLSAEIRHLGGGLRPEAAHASAAERGTPAPGAVAGLDAEYAVFGVGIAVPGASEALAMSLGRLPPGSSRGARRSTTSTSPSASAAPTASSASGCTGCAR
ncbi:MAG TPA: hypothetical protein VFS72_02415, partial [Agromyces sp.]|nr:hypothetical protein [Agromyces sp.]